MPRPMTTADLWELPRVGSPAASADGSVIVVPVTTSPEGEAVTVLYRVATGAEPVALTRRDVSSSAPAVSPDGRRLAFVRTVDGRRQAFVMPLDGGEARQVTDTPLGLVGGVRWGGDDHLMVVTRFLEDDPTPAATVAWRDSADDRPQVRATERRFSRAWDTWYTDPLTEHVLLVDLTTPDAVVRDVTPGTWLMPDPLRDPAAHCDLSPDGTMLAFTTADPDGDEDGVPILRVHVVDLEGDTAGEVRCLTPDSRGHAGPPRFRPDGFIVTRIAEERDFYACRQRLVLLEPRLGVEAPLLLDVDHGMESVEVGADGTIVIGTDEEARGVLHRFDDGDLVPMPRPDAGSLTLGPVTTAGVVALHSTPTSPPEVVLVTDDAVTPLTSFCAPGLAEVDLGRSEERWITGADGDQLHVLLVHPPAGTVDGDGPPPLVHLIHGGPHGVSQDGWHWRWCAARFAAEGWLVASVNFHGSTSYGHEWTRSILGDWGTLPAGDIDAATDALIAEGLVDPDRCAITGGSYGGYLTVWIATQTDRYAAAVAHAAVTDLGGMWATDWPNGFSPAFGTRIWEDPTATLARSPSMHYGSMSTPMLVLHGDNDLRVPIDQGRALYGVLQDMRIASRLVIFPTENHWILSRANSERWYEEVLGWLHRFLDR